jgi:hypothetical protein
MWCPFRFLCLFLLTAALAVAEESPSPTPAPEATPAAPPEASASPAPSPETTATPEATPGGTPPAEPTPSPTPGSAPDVIPLEVGPSGAPLETQDLAPLPAIDAAMPDDAFTQPNAVIPDAPPPPVGQTLDNAQEKLRLQSIRYKEVRTAVDKDPKVLSLRQQADRAKTPEDKRAALREYYRLLFKKMVAMDKSLEDKCREMEGAYLRRLAQDRLEPTIPLNPPPTPEPLN